MESFLTMKRYEKIFKEMARVNTGDYEYEGTIIADGREVPVKANIFRDHLGWRLAIVSLDEKERYCAGHDSEPRKSKKEAMEDLKEYFNHEIEVEFIKSLNAWCTKI